MKPIEKVSVIGAGIMGAGISRAILKYGLSVNLYDSDQTLLKQVAEDIFRKPRRGMDPGKLQLCSSLEEACLDTDLILEAIVENLDLKCELFRAMGKSAAADVIFASNTSSLSISRMAEASGRAERFLGLHFFNPAFLMRLVEVITTPKLAPEALSGIKEFIRTIKKTAVICKESPGFVANRILLPVINEAFFLLEERSKLLGGTIIDTANDIDSAIVKEEILLMGPYNLVDLTGLDTTHTVCRVIYEGFDQSPRYRPAPLLTQYVEAGRFGRKTKQGIYSYANTTNDPDLNPCLDEQGNRLEPVAEPRFSSLELTAVIVNEAFRVLEEQIVAELEDIELCMELGTRWPKGPFALAKKVGLDKIREILQRKYRAAGEDPRYQPSALLLKPDERIKKFMEEDQPA